MLFSRGQHVKACLVCHLLLLELWFEPIADRLVQSRRLLLNTLTMRIDFLDHSQRLQKVHAFRPNSLGTSRIQSLSEVFILWPVINLELVHRSCVCGLFILCGCCWLLHGRSCLYPSGVCTTRQHRAVCWLSSDSAAGRLGTVARLIGSTSRLLIELFESILELSQVVDLVLQ